MLKGHGGNFWDAARRYRVDPEKILDFSCSVNFMPTSAVYKKWISGGLHKIGRYPDPEYNELRQAISQLYGVRAALVVPANGSTELLYMAPRALGIKSALIVSPSYADYADACRMAKTRVKRFFLKPAANFEIDCVKLSGMAKSFDMVIIGNPNNPTGGVVKRKKLLNLVDNCRRTMFVIDEAFIDFLPRESLVKTVRKNLIVCRSLTKFYGIPGLRIGFAASHPDTIKKLWAHKEPWTVNCLAESFVLNIAENGFDSGAVIKNLLGETRYLYKNLMTLGGLTVFPGKANYLLCRINGKKQNAPSLKAALLRSGILIRDCSNFAGLDGSYFRLSARKRADNTVLLTALGKTVKRK